jgi:hypothetical protein
MFEGLRVIVLSPHRYLFSYIHSPFSPEGGEVLILFLSVCTIPRDQRNYIQIEEVAKESS